MSTATVSYNITIKRYHADNGLYDTKRFEDSIKASKHSLSFCGVNAHHENSKAQNRIKDVNSGNQTALLHEAHRWPQAIHASLWPSTLKNYVNIRNNVPADFIPERKHYLDRRRKINGSFHSLSLSKFSGVETEIEVKKFHPFGCPFYVLDSKLQAQQSKNK